MASHSVSELIGLFERGLSVSLPRNADPPPMAEPVFPAAAVADFFQAEDKLIRAPTERIERDPFMSAFGPWPESWWVLVRDLERFVDDTLPNAEDYLVRLNTAFEDMEAQLSLVDCVAARLVNASRTKFQAVRRCFNPMHVLEVRAVAQGDSAHLASCLDHLIYAANVDEDSTRDLIRFGALEAVLPFVTHAPSDAWLNDDYTPHPVWWLAFDVLTNLCKWSCARADLVAAKVPALLFGITQASDVYFGFEASEGLAYLVGGFDDADPAWTFRDVHMAQFARLFRGVMNDDREASMLAGMSFSKFGRILCVRRLAQRTRNHVHCAGFTSELVAELRGNFRSESQAGIMCVRALADLLRDSRTRSAFVREHVASPQWTFKLCGVDDELGRPVGLFVCLALVGARVDQVDASGSAPVFYAARQSESATRLLLQLGARTDRVNANRESVVFAAISGSSLGAAELIVVPAIREAPPATARVLLDLLVTCIRVPELACIVAREGFELCAVPRDFAARDEDADFEARIVRALRRGRSQRFLMTLCGLVHVVRRGTAHPLAYALRGFDENIMRRIFGFFVGDGAAQRDDDDE